MSKPDPEFQMLKKRILADPIDFLSRHKPEANKQERIKLAELWDAYRASKESHDEIQDQTRELSRKIGEAKKAGQAIDELKLLMQAHSKQKAQVSQQLQEIESNILVHFDITDTRDVPEPDMPRQLAQRAYRLNDICENTITISRLGDTDDEWNKYVQQNPAASFYHLASWRELIKKVFGHDSVYLYAKDAANVITGILPLIRLKSRLFGDFLVSMPYFNYGGAIADHPMIEKKLMSAANQYAADITASHVEYRDDIARPDLPVRDDKVNMILPLPSNEQTLWDGFTPKLRAQIKRPQREHPVIQHGGMEFLEEFYRVFARNMRDLGTPVYAKSFFQHILNAFPQQSRILIIRLKGKPVAAAFLIGYRETLEIPWASTLRKVHHLSINMLMYWEILRYAINNNFKYFDFGRSSKDAGTYQFKKQWGAVPKQLYWHYWLENGKELPSMNPGNPKYALAIALWKRLPIPIANTLGPLIVKNLP